MKFLKKHYRLWIFIVYLSGVLLVLFGPSLLRAEQKDSNSIVVKTKCSGLFGEFKTIALDQNGTIYATTTRNTIVKILDGKVCTEYAALFSGHFCVEKDTIYFLNSQGEVLAAYDKDGFLLSASSSSPVNLSPASSEVTQNNKRFFIKNGRFLSKIQYTNESGDLTTVLTRGNDHLVRTLEILIGIVWLSSSILWVVVTVNQKKQKQEHPNV